MIERFGEYELDTDRYELRGPSGVVAVEPQVFDVLAHLIRHRDRVVTKEELLDEIWGDRFVSESALTSRIKAARRAVGDDGRRQEVIRTAHGRGYRFVAAVEDVVDEAPGPVRPERPAQAPAAPANGDGERWPMLGRAELLETLWTRYVEGECGGVVLAGPPGVGKTALAERLLDVAEGAGVVVARTAAHAGASSIALAALAGILPPEVTELASTPFDHAAVFHRARQAFRQLGSASRPMVLVDDADQLDELSRALLVSEAAAGRAFLVLTVQLRRRDPPALLDLVREAKLDYVDVPYLAPETVEALLHRALGGPVTARTLRVLCDVSAGNPGILREVVDASRAAGALVEEDGVWRLRGSVVPSVELAGIVERRLRGISDAGMRAMEHLAVSGRIGVDLLAGIVGEDALDELDAMGLMDAHTDAGRTDVAPAHPLYGAIVASQLPSLRSRRIRARLVEAVEQQGARRAEDRIRLVQWRIDGGAEVDDADIVDAARLALDLDEDETAEELLDHLTARSAHPAALALADEIRSRRVASPPVGK